MHSRLAVRFSCVLTELNTDFVTKSCIIAPFFNPINQQFDKGVGCHILQQ
ncbi:hypothetical protein RNAN_2195 [Rheinheimera nanhaiensis E407-8]|uniref:Uncharacterized protein n=1 Tax=Rheinheimera nanhaiensis E407-8 TaxID=562729 RepID=I1DYS5_9GAMM|nr:hypothetical protein RNAN_2195 [Rheinheimera nanhaiensis E407-8]